MSCAEILNLFVMNETTGCKLVPCNGNMYEILPIVLGDNKYQCSWSALDFSVDPPKYRTFVAVFDSSETFNEFKDTFYEGKELAEQSEILENPEGAAE